MTATAAPAHRRHRRPRSPALAMAERVARRRSGASLVAVARRAVIFGVVHDDQGRQPDHRVLATCATRRSRSVGLDRRDPGARRRRSCFAALAVTVPARAGLINVGGEGQLVIGGVGAARRRRCGSVTALPGGVDARADGSSARAVGGARWAAHRRPGCGSSSGINEAVTTLLLNYIALDLHALPDLRPVEGPERVAASRRPRRFPTAQHLPLIGDVRLHLGIVIALDRHGARVARCSPARTWGFRLGVVGGNPEAARRAGLRVGALLLSSMARRRCARRPRRVRPARRRRVQAAAGLPRRLRLHRVPRQLARPPPARSRSRSRRFVLGRHRGRRRQPPDRLRPAGRVGEHPHGARAARGLRRGAGRTEGGAA